MNTFTISTFVETDHPSSVTTFTQKTDNMIEIDSEIYLAVANRIEQRIEGVDFFSGSIELDFPQFDSTFTATLIIYRQLDTDLMPPAMVVVDIVPVWWEFDTSRDGIEILNDFSFSQLKRYMTFYSIH